MCVGLQMLLESHEGWHQRFQRCKDRFEGLLKIDKLKKDVTKCGPAAAASHRGSATAAPSGEQQYPAHSESCGVLHLTGGFAMLVTTCNGFGKGQDV